MWVSLLSIYKGVYGYSTDPNLSTIIAPAADSLKFDYRFDKFTESFWNWINPSGRLPFKSGRTDGSMLYLRTAGPNASVSSLGAPFDAYAWSLQPVNHLVNFLIATNQMSIHAMYEASLKTFLGKIGQRARRILAGSRSLRQVRAATCTPILGRLSLKYEPAGKIRVFAIVDVFTQSALKPVHDWMFSLLRELSTDATFDQEGRVRDFAKLHQDKDIFSFDLSSATDLIPFALTQEIISSQMGAITDLWAKLLVDRDFETPVKEQSKVRYTRGQPIGALSSWSSLAITHHWLVQQAADRVGLFPYLDYLVLGDDISISGKPVADSYLALCAEYGVPINNKGIVSLARPGKRSLVNFANQILIGETNLSPIQIREEIAATNMSARAEYLHRLVRRGYLDLESPSFISKAFRLCSSSVRQIQDGMRSIAGGLLPRGIADLMTAFLLPSREGTAGSTLTYIYVRLLSGLDIMGGWSYFISVPNLMSQRTVIRKDMEPIFVELMLAIAPTIRHLLYNHIQTWRIPSGLDDLPPTGDPYGLLPADSDVSVSNLTRLLEAMEDLFRAPIKGNVDQIQAAQYFLANKIITSYFLKAADVRAANPYGETHVGNVILKYHELHSMMLGEKDSSLNLGAFLDKLWAFLQALDSFQEVPLYQPGVASVTRKTHPWGVVKRDLFPHSQEWVDSIINSDDFEFSGAFVTRAPEHDTTPHLGTPRATLVMAHVKPGTAMNLRPFEELVKADRVLWRAPRSVRFLKLFLRNPRIQTLIPQGRVGSNLPRRNSRDSQDLSDHVTP